MLGNSKFAPAGRWRRVRHSLIPGVNERQQLVPVGVRSMWAAESLQTTRVDGRCTVEDPPGPSSPAGTLVSVRRPPRDLARLPFVVG